MRIVASSITFASMVCASTLMLATISPLQAGNPGQCTFYANSAVAQNATNVANGCGYHGARWHPNFAAHFAWCLTASNSKINSERGARVSRLHSCTNPGPVVKKFNNPKIGGLRLDWCKAWASQCGGPAASAFCHAKGYAHAINWSKANNIGNWASTRVISSGQVCSQATCDGFKWVRCGN